MLTITRSILLMSLLLTGCATSVSKDLTFSAEDDTAFVVLVANNMANGNASFRFHFREVDVDNGEFLNGHFNIEFPAVLTFGALSSDQLEEPEGYNTSMDFGGKEIQPGKYVIVSLSKTESTGVGTTTYVTCYSLGTRVFDFEAGVVNVIPFHNSYLQRPPNEALALADSKKVIAGYPNVSSDVQLAPVINAISFDGGKSLLGKQTCNAKNGFTIAPNNSE